MATSSFEDHLRGVDAELDLRSIGESGDERHEQLQHIRLLKVIRFRFRMRVVDETGRCRGTAERQPGVEERKILRRLRWMPLDRRKPVPRAHDPISQRRDAHIDRARVIRGQIEAAREEERPLHPQRATGEARIAIAAGRHAVPAYNPRRYRSDACAGRCPDAPVWVPWRAAAGRGQERRGDFSAWGTS
jgi:hypothetical protein